MFSEQEEPLPNQRGSALAPAWMSEAELGEEAGERDGDDHNAAWLSPSSSKAPSPLGRVEVEYLKISELLKTDS